MSNRSASTGRPNITLTRGSPRFFLVSLFASVTPVRVGFLSPAATGQLLANPSDDFPLDFTRATIDHVYYWARGQPYLTQLVGHTLVRRYNQSVFELDQPRDSRFTPEEVDDVVSAPDFYEEGSHYFKGVWGQAEQSGPPGQTTLLRRLAETDGPASAADLFRAAQLPAATGEAALKTLEQHDVVATAQDDQVDFTVPLMRHWLRRYK